MHRDVGKEEGRRLEGVYGGLGKEILGGEEGDTRKRAGEEGKSTGAQPTGARCFVCCGFLGRRVVFGAVIASGRRFHVARVSLGLGDLIMRLEGYVY